jgi:hypothetical protein
MPVGSIAVVAVIAPVVFWGRVVLASVRGRVRLAGGFALVGIAGHFGLAAIRASAFETSYVAVLAIALVFIVVGRDVRLT